MEISEDNRRSFLKSVFFGAAGIAGGTLGGVAGGYLIGGAKKTDGMRAVPLLPVADLTRQPVLVTYRELVSDAWRTMWTSGSAYVSGSEIGEVTVFDPSCTHMGCPVAFEPSEGVFKCPCHRGIFGIDGAVLAGPPPRPLDRLASRIEDGRVYLLKGDRSDSAIGS